MATHTADRLFGEPVRLSFFKGGAVDPNRPVADIRAQLHLPGETDVTPARSNSSFTTQVMGGTGLLIIQKSIFSGELLQGDKVRADAREGQPWLEILAVDVRDANQIVAQISIAARASPAT
ncbi:hypothetical protein [Devosia ginsengisoli]|uniref:hypothetical protein n=1 Tax=Devosia ginsengisoli TaxID=400770 RepID=UPI0026F22F02|nr:hypothetical protein [Devosia ginsengisoli]MCR6672196.1 hypothetical protein [Devosia ginsengisoli]